MSGTVVSMMKNVSTKKYTQEDFNALQATSRMEFLKQLEKERIETLLNKIPRRYQSCQFEKFETPKVRQAEIAATLRDFGQEFTKIRGQVSGAILHGNTGTGKTYLGFCLYKNLVQQGLRVRYETLTNCVNVVLACRPDHYASCLNTLLDVDLLIIDEVSLPQNRSYQVSEQRQRLFDVIDGRYSRANNPTVLITNHGLSELNESIGARIMDRILDEGLALAFNWESYRTRWMNDNREPHKTASDTQKPSAVEIKPSTAGSFYE